MRLETDENVEVYVNEVKKPSGNSQSKPNSSGKDSSKSDGKLPQTGVESPIFILIAIVLISGIGIVGYVQYKKLSRYIK